MFKNLKKKIEESGEFVPNIPQLNDPIEDETPPPVITSKATSSTSSVNTDNQRSRTGSFADYPTKATTKHPTPDPTPSIDFLDPRNSTFRGGVPSSAVPKFSLFGEEDEDDVATVTSPRDTRTPRSISKNPSDSFNFSGFGSSNLFPTNRTPNFMPQSDIESECGSEMGEEVAIQDVVDIDIFSKEQLFYKVKRVLTQLTKYRGRYSEVTHAYKMLEREREKMQNALMLFQDKALRRMNEMKEAAQLDQQAKAHMEHSFRLLIEEKEDMIKVLKTQNKYLKESNALSVTPPKTSGAEELVKDETDARGMLRESDLDAAFDSFVKSERTLKGGGTYESEIVQIDPMLNSDITAIERKPNKEEELSEALENALERLRSTHQKLMEVESKKEESVSESTQTSSDLKDSPADGALNLLDLEKDEGEVADEGPSDDLLAYRRDTKIELNEECGELKMRLEYLENEFVRKVNETDELAKELEETFAKKDELQLKLSTDLKSIYAELERFHPSYQLNLEVFTSAKSDASLDESGNGDNSYFMEKIMLILKDLAKERDGLVDRVSDFQNEHESASLEKREMQDRLSVLTRSIAEVEASRDEVVASSRVAEQSDVELRNKLEASEGDRQRLEAEVGELKGDIEGLKGEVFEKVEMIESLTKEREQLEEKLSLKEGELKVRNEEIVKESEKLRQEIGECHDKAVLVQSDLASYREALREVTEEKEVLSTKVELLTSEKQSQLSKHSQNIEEIEVAWKSRYEDLKSRVGTDDALKEVEMEHSRNNLTLARVEINSLNGKTQELEKELHQYRNEAERIKQDLSDSQNAVREFEAKYVGLLGEIEEVREVCENQRIDFETRYAVILGQAKEFSEKIVDLENDKILTEDMMLKTESRHAEILQSQRDEVDELARKLETLVDRAKEAKVVLMETGIQTDTIDDTPSQPAIQYPKVGVMDIDTQTGDDNKEDSVIVSEAGSVDDKRHIVEKIARLEMELALKDQHISQVESKLGAFSKRLGESQTSLVDTIAGLYGDKSSHFNDLGVSIPSNTPASKQTPMDKHKSKRSSHPSTTPSKSSQYLKHRDNDMTAQLEELYTIMHDSDHRMKDTIDEYDKKLEQREAQIANLKNQIYARQEELSNFSIKFAFYAEQNFVKALKDYKSTLLNNFQTHGIITDGEIEKIVSESGLAKAQRLLWTGPITQIVSEAVSRGHDFGLGAIYFINQNTNHSSSPIQDKTSPQSSSGWEHDTVPLTNFDTLPNQQTSPDSSPYDKMAHDQSPDIRHFLSQLTDMYPSAAYGSSLVYSPENSFQDGLQSFSTYPFGSRHRRSSPTPSITSSSTSTPPPLFPETSELEYLRKIIYEYMMGHEPLIMAKVISATLKFSEDKRDKILAKERSRVAAHTRWL